MTANPFAALLRDVPRYENTRAGDLEECADGSLVGYDAVLAALAAAVPADLAEAGKVLEGVTPGRVVQFHPSFCKEAEGAPFSEWDSSHDLSVIQPDGKRYRIGSMRHANDAAFFQWCREGVPALLARIAAQEVQIKGLRAERDTVLGMYMRSSEEGFRQKARAEAAETALAAMTKERDYADGTNEVLRGENQRLETALAAERAKTAKLVEAGDRLADTAESGVDLATAVTAWDNARAAITEAGQ